MKDVRAYLAKLKAKKNGSMVDHPQHYNQVPGIECIDVVKNFDFVIGNAIKYLWRLGHKGGGDKRLEDLKKAKWYIDYAISEEEKLSCK